MQNNTSSRYKVVEHDNGEAAIEKKHDCGDNTKNGFFWRDFLQAGKQVYLGRRDHVRLRRWTNRTEITVCHLLMRLL